MKGNARTRSEEVHRLLKSQYKKSGLTYRKIATKSYQSEESITLLIDEGALPASYKVFLRVCNVLNVPEKELNKLKKSDTAFLFSYWDEIKPKAPTSKHFGKFLMTKYMEKGFSRQEIIELTGKTPAALSMIFNNKAALTWPMLCDICSVIELNPADFLSEYERSNLQSYSFEFTDVLVTARKSQNLTKQEMAEKCGLSFKRYEKIESGVITVYDNELSLISPILKVPYTTLETYAKRAGIFSTIHSTRVKRKKLYDLLTEVSEYKYIDTELDKIESHTLIVLVLMLLHNKDERYKPDILYYLNHLYISGNLALQLHSPSEETQITEVGVLEVLRESQGYTYASLAEESGISGAALFEFLNGRSTPYIKNLITLSKVLGASITLSFEYIARGSGPKKEMAEAKDFFATLDSAKEWEYNDVMIPSEDLIDLFETIFSNTSSLKRYKKLKESVQLPNIFTS